MKVKHEMSTKDLGFTWKDKVTNFDVLSRTSFIYFTMLSQRRLGWLGHVQRMEKGRLPKDLLYGNLELGKRQQGHPYLRYKDSCLRDLQ